MSFSELTSLSSESSSISSSLPSFLSSSSSSLPPFSTIQLPGPFVVYQGTPGDGMRNTIENNHSLPIIIASSSSSSSNWDDSEDDDSNDDDDEDACHNQHRSGAGQRMSYKGNATGMTTAATAWMPTNLLLRSSVNGNFMHRTTSASMLGMTPPYPQRQPYQQQQQNHHTNSNNPNDGVNHCVVRSAAAATTTTTMEDDEMRDRPVSLSSNTVAAAAAANEATINTVSSSTSFSSSSTSSTSSDEYVVVVGVPPEPANQSDNVLPVRSSSYTPAAPTRTPTSIPVVAPIETTEKPTEAVQQQQPAAQQNQHSTVSQQQQQPGMLPEQKDSMIRKWESACRQIEIEQYNEWEQERQFHHHQHQQQQHQHASPSSNSYNSNPSTDDCWWMDSQNGELLVFQTLPSKAATTATIIPLLLPISASSRSHTCPTTAQTSASSTVTANRRFASLPTKNIIGSIPPGAVVNGIEMITVDSNNFDTVLFASSSSSSTSTVLFPFGKKGWTQFLKIHKLPNHQIRRRPSLQQQQQPPSRKEHNTASTTTAMNEVLCDATNDDADTNYHYVVYSIDGYSYLGSGPIHDYVQPDRWYWRVTCNDGAYVRSGLDLSTSYVTTIPYGSIVQVTRKTINVMGLSRLHIQTIIAVPKTQQQQTLPSSAAFEASSELEQFASFRSTLEQQSYQLVPIEGWCSEFLNPLSGQRGCVLQSMSFPVPVLYNITYEEGAILRDAIELSSREIQRVPLNTKVCITGRIYSENPIDQCIERLKVSVVDGGANNSSGYISVRLNLLSPQNTLICNYHSIDSTFDPMKPGEYHIQQALLRQQQHSRQQQQSRSHHQRVNDDDDDTHMNSFTNSSSIGDIDSCYGDVNDDEISEIESSTHGDADQRRKHNSKHKDASSVPVGTIQACDTNETKQRRIRQKKKRQQLRRERDSYNNTANRNDACLICLSSDRTATIVHGGTGHIACCLQCARILKARDDPCPVCRINIDFIIQHFYA